MEVSADFFSSFQNNKLKYSLKGLLKGSSETADLVTFTEEILNGKLYFFVQCLGLFQTIMMEIFWKND